MSTARKIVSLPGNRRAKWAVLVFWLIVAVVAAPLSSKLMGAEKNQASSWLPAKAESTKVLDIQAKIQSPNDFPAVVVYYRPAGLTAADRAKATADLGRFATVHGALPHSLGPFPSADGKALDTTLLLAAGAVVVLLLLLTYRSPVLWLLPVLSVVVSLFAAQAFIYLLAAHAGLTVNGQSAGILIVL